MSTTATGPPTITEYEVEQVERANASGRTPVVFVHGLWLLPNSWDRWTELFEQAGYAAVTPGWPDDPETVEEAKAHPEVFAQQRGPDRRPRRVGDPAARRQARCDRPFLRRPAHGDPRAPGGSAVPLFQAAAANLNPWTEVKADTKNPERGPLLIISGEEDHTVPWAIANASYKREKRNEGVTEIVKMPSRGHALTIDSGWREVADSALQFVRRFTGGQ